MRRGGAKGKPRGSGPFGFARGGAGCYFAGTHETRGAHVFRFRPFRPSRSLLDRLFRAGRRAGHQPDAQPDRRRPAGGPGAGRAARRLRRGRIPAVLGNPFLWRRHRQGRAHRIHGHPFARTGHGLARHGRSHRGLPAPDPRRPAGRRSRRPPVRGGFARRRGHRGRRNPPRADPVQGKPRRPQDRGPCPRLGGVGRLLRLRAGGPDRRAAHGAGRFHRRDPADPQRAGAQRKNRRDGHDDQVRQEQGPAQPVPAGGSRTGRAAAGIDRRHARAVRGLGRAGAGAEGERSAPAGRRPDLHGRRSPQTQAGRRHRLLGPSLRRNGRAAGHGRSPRGDLPGPEIVFRVAAGRPPAAARPAGALERRRRAAPAFPLEAQAKIGRIGRIRRIRRRGANGYFFSARISATNSAMRRMASRMLSMLVA